MEKEKQKAIHRFSCSIACQFSRQTKTWQLLMHAFTSLDGIHTILAERVQYINFLNQNQMLFVKKSCMILFFFWQNRLFDLGYYHFGRITF